MKDDFASVAEWVRRQKLHVPDQPVKDCIVCLRKGQHIFSVAPGLDPDLEDSPEMQQFPHMRGLNGVSGALIWSVGLLNCDEYFFISDSGERVLVQRFAINPDYDSRKSWEKSNPGISYPTTATYRYEVKNGRIVWGHVSAQNKDLEKATWDLWHCALAGHKIRVETMAGLTSRLDQEFARQGLTLEQQRNRVNRGMAAFVSDKKGVRAVMYNTDPLSPTGSTLFEDGKPYNFNRTD